MPPTPAATVPQGLTDVIKRIGDDAEAIATTIASLRGSISTSMTQDEVTGVQGTLEAIEVRLKGINADPSNPIPAGPVPTPPANLTKKK